MNCDELAQLLPDLVDGTLPNDILAEAEAALSNCPECQQELAVSRQIRTFLVALQVENPQLVLPPGFETRLLARIQAQHSSLELLDLSSKAFGLWLVELINLIGGLIVPASTQTASQGRPGGA